MAEKSVLLLNTGGEMMDVAEEHWQRKVFFFCPDVHEWWIVKVGRCSHMNGFIDPPLLSLFSSYTVFFFCGAGPKKMKRI